MFNNIIKAVYVVWLNTGEPDCNGHGTCRRVLSSSVCACNSGFEGNDCSTLICPGPNCNGNGKYITFTTIIMLQCIV